MRISIFIAILTGVFLTPCVRADEDKELEKRIEQKVVATQKAETKKSSATKKAKLDAKADKHANSAKATKHPNGKPKIPLKKPKPLPGHH